jgi:hypothetical protein
MGKKSLERWRERIAWNRLMYDVPFGLRLLNDGFLVSILLLLLLPVCLLHDEDLSARSRYQYIK